MFKTSFITGLVLVLGCATEPAGGALRDDAAVAGDATPVEDAAVDRAVPTDEGLPGATYAGVQAIFRRSCAGYCHAGGVDVGASHRAGYLV